MDNFVIRDAPKSKQRLSIKNRWERSMVEISGRHPKKYRHELSSLLRQSYSEVGVSPHFYSANGHECSTQMNLVSSIMTTDVGSTPTRRLGISALEFDSKGIYVASVTKSGCLSVHDFESLHCQTSIPPKSHKDEAEELLHLSVCQQLDAVKWNRANENEIGCSSRNDDDVRLFDISYISSEPFDVLRKKPTSHVQGYRKLKGLSEVTFVPSDKSRVVACGLDGVLYFWDRRMSNFPCFELTAACCESSFNTIELSQDEQLVFAASEKGNICIWDLRGGRTSAAFSSVKEVYHPPLMIVKPSSSLKKIMTLKEQSEILSCGIQSIKLDPSCPYQLAFHLDDAWSGVLNLNCFEVTHIHCPPPPWLDENGISSNYFARRKPDWLPELSVYIVPSSYVNGIHLLDFYPNATAASHINFGENYEAGAQVQNTFLRLSGMITACVAHPVNGTILAGTMSQLTTMWQPTRDSLESFVL